MMNKSTLDFSNRYLETDKKFKFISDFVKNFNAKVEDFYTQGEYFVIEFNTEENCGQIDIANDEISIKHNVFDDFVTMRKYIEKYFKEDASSEYLNKSIMVIKGEEIYYE